MLLLFTNACSGSNVGLRRLPLPAGPWRGQCDECNPLTLVLEEPRSWATMTSTDSMWGFALLGTRGDRRGVLLQWSAGAVSGHFPVFSCWPGPASHRPVAAGTVIGAALLFEFRSLAYGPGAANVAPSCLPQMWRCVALRLRGKEAAGRLRSTMAAPDANASC